MAVSGQTGYGGAPGVYDGKSDGFVEHYFVSDYETYLKVKNDYIKFYLLEKVNKTSP